MQRKVFRIERLFAGGRAAGAAEPAAQHHVVDELKALRALAEHRDEQAADAVQMLTRELALVHDTIARNKHELGLMIGDGKERRLARGASELGAAIDGMEKATVNILKSVEVVDESARALTATLKDDYKRGLAQDIQDHVVQIYEACNFQDLAGQRIAGVIAILNTLERQVAVMLERCAGGEARSTAAKPAPKPAPKPASKSSSGNRLLNGPKLDGDHGHASQRDIDKMFN